MSGNTTVARPTGIPVRRPQVDLANAEVGEGWLVPDDPIFSHVLAALSAVFPNGEDFFVDSVRNYRDQSRRPGPEGSREGLHRPGVDARARAPGPQRAPRGPGLSDLRVRRPAPASCQLDAAPAPQGGAALRDRGVGALHLGARPRRPHRRADPAHAVPAAGLRAADHLARARGARAQGRRLRRAPARRPSYAVRLLGITFAVVGWGPAFVRPALQSVRRDRADLTRKARRQFRRNYRHQRMLGHTTLPALAQYLRPRFHPRDLDSDALVTEWRARLEPRMRVSSAS